jgi:hypothetical protein
MDTPLSLVAELFHQQGTRLPPIYAAEICGWWGSRDCSVRWRDWLWKLLWIDSVQAVGYMPPNM